VLSGQNREAIIIIKKLQAKINLMKPGNILFSTFLTPFMGKEFLQKFTA
jgi:hypothetical protein